LGLESVGNARFSGKKDNMKQTRT